MQFAQFDRLKNQWFKHETLIQNRKEQTFGTKEKQKVDIPHINNKFRYNKTMYSLPFISMNENGYYYTGKSGNPIYLSDIQLTEWSL